MDGATMDLRVANVIALCASITLASACSTLSESQCRANDWQTVGFSDGSAGHNSSRLLKHSDACMKHGVAPDRELYLAGWEEGVTRYCTPDNGFQQGNKGATYNNVCPPHLAPSFLDAYENGRQLHLAQAEINRLQNLINTKTNALARAEKKLRSAETRLVADDVTSSERMALVEDTKALARQQGQLQTKITDLRVEVAVKQDRLNSLRQMLAHGY
jgi:hypothetical protein